MALLVPTGNLIDLIGSAIDTILDETEGKRVGIVLSGGLDSSTVAMMANSVRPGLPVFTGWYDEPGFDERQYSRRVIAELDKPAGSGWAAWEIEIRPEDFVEHFDAVKAALGPLRPGMGAVGQYMVAKFLSEHGIEIAMSGEGSDELFGGYARQMIVAGEQPPVGYEHYQMPEGYPTDLQGALDADYAALPALLAVDDQMLGAWGLEARAPFTDPKVVEYGLSLPITERVGKRHLRNLVRGIVPDSIIDRKDKAGFPAPFAIWAQEEPMRSFIRDRIGYLPNPYTPFDRGWWKDMLDQ